MNMTDYAQLDKAIYEKILAEDRIKHFPIIDSLVTNMKLSNPSYEAPIVSESVEDFLDKMKIRP